MYKRKGAIIMKDKSSNDIFASNLRYYLEKRGYIQADLARNIKVSTGTVADWCTGRNHPRMDKVELIADFLGIQKSDLIEERCTKLNNDNINEIAKDISENLDNLKLYIKIKNLSHPDREIVEALINNLERRNG